MDIHVRAHLSQHPCCELLKLGKIISTSNTSFVKIWKNTCICQNSIYHIGYESNNVLCPHVGKTDLNEVLNVLSVHRKF